MIDRLNQCQSGYTCNVQLLLNIHADLFDYEANPAYTLVEAPHQKQGKFNKL